jgi:glycosyltransferase involved in cell wall biosynthesis
MSNPAQVPVSVIIANYNSGQYLTNCIRSINSGQWPEEILLVDDASTDESLDLAKQLAIENSNLRIIALPNNGGAAAARKIAIQEARSEWIAIVDADDFLEEGAVATALGQALLEGSDICLWQLWRFDSDRQWPILRLNEEDFPISGRKALVATLGKWALHPLGVSKKALYIEAYSGFNQTSFNADELLTRLVFSRAGLISVCTKKYLYRLNTQSLSLKKKHCHLSGLDSAIWLVNFSKQYPEVSPGLVGSRAISCAWQIFKARAFYGEQATQTALSRFLLEMAQYGELKKWLWRYPRRLFQWAVIWLVYRGK